MEQSQKRQTTQPSATWFLSIPKEVRFVILDKLWPHQIAILYNSVYRERGPHSPEVRWFDDRVWDWVLDHPPEYWIDSAAEINPKEWLLENDLVDVLPNARHRFYAFMIEFNWMSGDIQDRAGSVKYFRLNSDPRKDIYIHDLYNDDGSIIVPTEFVLGTKSMYVSNMLKQIVASFNATEMRVRYIKEQVFNPPDYEPEDEDAGDAYVRRGPLHYEINLGKGTSVERVQLYYQLFARGFILTLNNLVFSELQPFEENVEFTISNKFYV